MQFYFYFICREKSLYKVDMYHDVVSTTKNVLLLNMISQIIFAGALTIFTGALPAWPPQWWGGRPTVAALCEQADEQLFRLIKHTPTHPLRRLLPSEHSTSYQTRARLHNYELASKIISIDECNFVYRVLYKDCF